MNYLAHAFLSPDDPMILMGNLWGDLIKPKDYSTLDHGILEGVKRHKKIDAFTDQHEGVGEIVNLLRPYQGKYTPVVVDVIMDFTLSKYWDRFNDQSIEEFCQKRYQVVNTNLQYLPDRLHPRILRMLSHRWLESCANRERMEQTFRMLSQRASFDNTIAEAMTAYDQYQSTIDVLFLNFFTEVQDHINLQNEG